jgi:hypothetical protein
MDKKKVERFYAQTPIIADFFSLRTATEPVFSDSTFEKPAKYVTYSAA